MTDEELAAILQEIAQTTELMRKFEDCGVSTEVTLRLYKVFLESSAAIAAELQESKLSASNASRMAHRLKGAAGFIGAKRLASLAAYIEESCADLNELQIRHTLQLLFATYAETRDYVANTVARSAAS